MDISELLLTEEEMAVEALNNSQDSSGSDEDPETDPVNPLSHVPEDDHHSEIVEDIPPQNDVPRLATRDTRESPLTRVTEDHRLGQDDAANEEVENTTEGYPINTSLCPSGDSGVDGHTSEIKEQVLDSKLRENRTGDNRSEMNEQVSGQGDRKDGETSVDASPTRSYSEINHKHTQEGLVAEKEITSPSPGLGIDADGRSLTADVSGDPPNDLISQAASMIASSVARDRLNTGFGPFRACEDPSGTLVDTQVSADRAEATRPTELPSTGNDPRGSVNPILVNVAESVPPASSLGSAPGISGSLTSQRMVLDENQAPASGKDKDAGIGSLEPMEQSVSNHLSHSLPHAKVASTSAEENCISEDVSHYIMPTAPEVDPSVDHVFQYEDYLDALSEHNFDADSEEQTKANNKTTVVCPGNEQAGENSSQMGHGLDGQLMEEAFSALQQDLGDISNIPVSVQGFQGTSSMSQRVHNAQEMTGVASVMTSLATTLAQEINMLPQEFNSSQQARSPVYTEGVTFSPQGVVSLPQMTSVHQAVTMVPQGMTVLPQELASLPLPPPQVTTMQQMMTSVPEGMITFVPQEMTSLAPPQVAAFPQVTAVQQTMAPDSHGITFLPQRMTSSPHVTTVHHQALSTVMPGQQGMTFVPQHVTSFEPQVTSVAQEMAMAPHELSSALQETLDAIQHEIPVSPHGVPLSLQDMQSGLQASHGIQYPDNSFAIQVSASEMVSFIPVGTQVTPAMFQGGNEPMQEAPLDYSMKKLNVPRHEKRKADDDYIDCASPAKVARLPMDLSTPRRTEIARGEQMDVTCSQKISITQYLPTESLRTVANKVTKIDACSQTCDQQDTLSNGGAGGTRLVQNRDSQPMSTINLDDISSELTAGGNTPKEAMSGVQKKDQPKRMLFIPTSTLREVDVGICTYIGDHEGFSGIIKDRYEDFVVHEINEARQVIHLTDFSCPQDEKEAVVDTSGVFSTEDSEALNKLKDSEDKSGEHLIDVTSASKEVRTKIHTAIRQNYTGLESNTTEKGETKYIKITKKAKGGKSRVCKWPKTRPKYCKFVLSKENIDTNETLSLMAKYLRIRPHAFQYAGTKDKRAVTVQEMTIQKFDAKKLSKLNQQLRGIRLGNFRYVEKPLSLGELSGNHFEIILREVKGEIAEIEKAVTSLKENGFVNYFGMQRFGNTSVPTHHIGRAVLKNQWEEAIDLILLPKPGDDSHWRQHWAKTRDAKSTLATIPHHGKRLSLEKQILKSLSSTKNNYCQAFASIPRNARMLYLHSYQSRVWNTVATRRIPPKGVSVNAGDLVARKNDNASWICPERVGDDMVHKYSSEDIVLPLPGHSVIYPDNEASIYKDILAEDGITMDHLKHKVKDYSLPGAYRKLIVIPRNVTWSFIKYNDGKLKLIQSDLDRIEGIAEPVQEKDGSKLALKISFSLPTSAYATMALRELMKTETASAHHAALTQENRKEEEGR